MSFIIDCLFIVGIFMFFRNLKRKYQTKKWNRQNPRFKGFENQFNSQQFMDEMTRQQNERFMEESLKSVTPWELGGYDMTQGNSFNEPNNFGGGMNGF